MSELLIYERARVRLEEKRRQLAAVISSGDTEMSEISATFIIIQNALDAMDKAIADERRQVDPTPAGQFANPRR